MHFYFHLTYFRAKKLLSHLDMKWPKKRASKFL